jgi:glyoxylase I family protein
MSTIAALAHVCLKTADLGATESFYCDLMGFKKQFDFTRDGKHVGFYLKIADNLFLEAFQADAPEPASTDNQLSHFCLETNDIESLRSRLESAGFQPGPIKEGADATLQFWVKDPNGISIEVQQYTENSAQFKSDPVEIDW